MDEETNRASGQPAVSQEALAEAKEALDAAFEPIAVAFHEQRRAAMHGAFENRQREIAQQGDAGRVEQEWKPPTRIFDRKVLGHGCEETLEVFAGERSCGGAPDAYSIEARDGDQLCSIDFQSGPLSGTPNGVTIEALLAVIIDRLECFQADGSLACPENHRVIYRLKAAMAYCHARTRDRIARGVKGTLAP